MQQTGVTILQPPNQDLGPKIPHKNKDLQRNENGSMIMNQRNLKIICQNQGLYEYPEMNNKIYLHFKVIQKIQNLDKYVNLKTLYLQNNVITKIQNIDCLVNLQNLFLHNNMIKKIENLQKLKQLRVLNLNNNNIFKIEGLSELIHLQNLNIAQNYLTEFQDLEHLGQCTEELTAIDLSHNQIKPNILLLNLIPQVKCLYLSGNPLVRETKHYRRVIVGTLRHLLYLDQRGIDKEQRMLSQAFVEGGQKAYKQARQKVHQHRLQVKQQKRQQIMKDIDVHRNRKINMFQRNIQQAEEQIEKIRGYMNEKGNQDMEYFYESKIAQLYEKIRQNQQFIKNINKRIGAAAKSISSENSEKNMSESQKSICSEENKDQSQTFNNQSIIQDKIEKKSQQKNENRENFQITQNGQNKQNKTLFPDSKQGNQQEQFQESFSKNQEIPAYSKKIEIPLEPPAQSTGLDELD